MHEESTFPELSDPLLYLSISRLTLYHRTDIAFHPLSSTVLSLFRSGV